MDKPPDSKGFSREPERFEITWRGIVIEIRYRPPFAHFYLEHPIAYLEVTSIEPKRSPLPISKTGYVSRVVQGVDIDAEGGPVDYVRAWLNHRAAKSAKWRQQTPSPAPPERPPGHLRQNSTRAWNAIMRGELSPPNPTPNSPVGGEVG
jgi:hypothetical protein